MTGPAAVPYEALAEAIAHHVHRHHYHEEARVDLPPIHTFDTLCASYFQIPAGVLEKLGLLEPLDDIGRRFAFTTTPEHFAAKIRANRKTGCSFDTLVLAAIELVEKKHACQTLLDMLAALGLCEPVTCRTRTVPAPPKRYEDFPNREMWRTMAIPDFEITWTARRDHYDQLFKTWPELIE
jgi:hypothetical protein